MKLVAYSTVVVLLAVLPATSRGQSVLDYLPYKMRVYVVHDPPGVLSATEEQELTRGLPEKIDARIGGAWRGLSPEPAAAVDAEAAPEAATTLDVRPVEVLTAPAALAFALRRTPHQLAVEHLPVEVFKFDKIMLLHVAAEEGGFRLTARDFDVRTQVFSLPAAVSCRQPGKLAESAFAALYQAFAPLAEVDLVEEDRAKLVIQASALKLRDETLSLAPSDAVFIPVLRYNNRDQTPKTIREVPWSFVINQPQPETPGLDWQVVSGLRNALTSRRRGRIETLALAAKLSDQPTTLVVASRTDKRRLPGYEVFSYLPPNPKTTLVGYTDWRGELTIPPKPITAEGEPASPLMMLVIKNGGEFLAKLPVLPGWREQVIAEIRDDDQRLSVEGFITALQEDMVEVYITRTVLMARAKKALEQGQPTVARENMNGLKELKSLTQFREELAARQNDSSARSSDPATQGRIDRLFSDTRTTLEKFLDEKPVEALEQQVRQAGG